MMVVRVVVIGVLVTELLVSVSGSVMVPAEALVPCCAKKSV